MRCREFTLASVLAAGLLWPGVPSAAEPEPPQQHEPLDVGLVEKQVVAVAEVQILVTDAQGRAVADLAPREIRVFEGGKEQRLAFLEPVSGSRIAPDGSQKEQPPAPLYSAAGEHAAGAALGVLPAKAVRRIVLAFDVRNSRRPVRENWTAAAQAWLASGMRDDDRVAIVLLGTYPEWRVEFTDDRVALQSGLGEVSLKKAAPSSDRRRDVTSLMNDIAECMEAEGGRFSSGNAVDCSFNRARSHVQRWAVDAEESVQNLRSLVGQLAAVPGRKAVLLFTQGIVDDASMRAVDAIVASFGSADNNLDVHKMKTRLLNRDVLLALADLRKAARAGGVTFLTLDTKEGTVDGFGGRLERGGALPAQSLGINPWTEMNGSTSQSVAVLARETGGRAYGGIRDLDENLNAAANLYFGMYVVGYYRSDPDASMGKLRVEIAREDVEVDYHGQAEIPARPATVTQVDLSVGRPVPSDGENQALPLRVRLAFDDLPLRGAGKTRGTVLGIHVQAIRPDGTVVAERLDVEVVAIERSQSSELAGTGVEHQTELVLPPGPYRIVARVSDDRQQLIADRAIDLTLEAGSDLPGLGPT